MTDLAREQWTDADGDGELDAGEDEGLPLYVNKSSDDPKFVKAFAGDGTLARELLTGTTAPYSIITFKNGNSNYSPVDFEEKEDIEWWAQRAERKWDVGAADKKDWSNPGVNKE